MPLNPKNRDGLPEFDQKFLKVIDECDWHVMKVAPRVGEEGHLWAYSTGIYYKFRHPEIIIFGQSLDLMHSMVNTIGNRVRSGEKFESNYRYSEVIDEYDCEFRDVNVDHYEEYVGCSIWFYDCDQNSFPMLQCFWPDMAGKFPWQKGCANWAVEAQPLLFNPPLKIYTAIWVGSGLSSRARYSGLQHRQPTGFVSY